MIRQFWRDVEVALAAWEPDIVHAQDLNTLPAAVAYARKRRSAGSSPCPVRVVYDSHELWRHRNRNGHLSPLGRLSDWFLEHRLIHQADAVIAVSPSIGGWLERTYHLPNEVHLVRNTPSRPVGLHLVSGPQLPRQPGEKVIGYSGRFTSGRGLEEAIEALTMLHESVVLCAVGYGNDDYVDSLTALARRLGVADRLRVVPPVAPDQVAAAMASADCALVAVRSTCLSYRYCLPNKLFEAIQAGVPVVATNLPDVAEVVRGYGLGTVFAAASPRELAHAVNRVLEMGDAVRAGARRAAGELCWEVEADRLVDCYREIGQPW